MKKLLLILLFFFTACNAPPKAISILEQSSCDLPCWNDVVAGQSTEVDLLRILKGLSIVDQTSIQNSQQPWFIFENVIHFSINQRSTVRGTAYFENNILSQFGLCGELNMPIRDVVEEIGNPEFILSGGLVEDSRRNVYMINSQKGVSLWYTTDKKLGNRQYVITPDILVDCITLFDPAQYTKLLDAKLLTGGMDAEEGRKLYPWNGYGDLFELYPPK